MHLSPLSRALLLALPLALASSGCKTSSQAPIPAERVDPALVAAAVTVMEQPGFLSGLTGNLDALGHEPSPRLVAESISNHIADTVTGPGRQEEVSEAVILLIEANKLESLAHMLDGLGSEPDPAEVAAATERILVEGR